MNEAATVGAEKALIMIRFKDYKNYTIYEGKKSDQDQKRNSNLGHGGGGSSSSVLHLQESTSLEEEVA